MQPPFGLDISDSSLKLISFRKRNKQIKLVSYNQIEVPEGYFIDGEIKEKEKIIELIQALISTTKGEKIKTPYLISTLPETKTFIKLIEIPVSFEKVDLEIIKKEIIQHIPLPLEEVYLDWQKIATKEGKLKILVSVCPKRIVESYLSLLERAGLKPLALEPESASLSRAIVKEDFLEGLIILDLGAKRSSIIVFDYGTIQFTVTLSISGEKITKTISEKLKITLEEAEKAKIICGFEEKKCQGILEEMLFSVVEDLTKKIEEAINFYKENHLPPDHRKITKIFLCGGGANFKGLEEILSQRLKLEVKKANPLLGLEFSSGLNLNQTEALIYATAIGLALRGLESV